MYYIFESWNFIQSEKNLNPTHIEINVLYKV